MTTAAAPSANFSFAGADDAEHNQRKDRDDLFAPLRESNTERRRSAKRQVSAVFDDRRQRIKYERQYDHSQQAIEPGTSFEGAAEDEVEDQILRPINE
jgi:hypothetical protein